MLEKIAATPISELELREPARASADTPLIDVITRMREMRRGAAIIEESGSLAGIFTERDLMLRVDHMSQSWHRRPVGEVMTRELVVVSGRDSLSVALKKMKKGLFRHLPVDLGPGKPVALVSIRDILAHLVEFYPAEFINLPPGPDHEPQSPWGG
jgi:CBS domain-containing protein